MHASPLLIAFVFLPASSVPAVSTHSRNSAAHTHAASTSAAPVRAARLLHFLLCVVTIVFVEFPWTEDRRPWLNFGLLAERFCGRHGGWLGFCGGHRSGGCLRADYLRPCKSA